MLSAHFHPDKNKHKSEEEQDVIAAQYKFIKEAWSILGDDRKRKAYDAERKIEAAGDFMTQRQQYDSFLKLQQNSTNDVTLEDAQKNFQRIRDQKNETYGLNVSEDKTALIPEILQQKQDNLKQQREIEDLECRPTRMFNDNFDRNEFNKAFVKRNHGKPSKDIVEYKDIEAYNDGGFASVNFGNIDYDAPFVEDNFIGNDNYANLSLHDRFKKNKTIRIKPKTETVNESDNENSDKSSESDESSESNESTGSAESGEFNDKDILNNGYYEDEETTNKKKKEIASTNIDDLIKQRKIDENTILKKNLLTRQKDQELDKFSISKNLGFMIGTEYFGDQMKRPAASLPTNKKNLHERAYTNLTMREKP